MFNMETFQIVVGLLYTKIRYIEIHFQVYIQNPYLALKKLAIIYILSGQKFIKNAKKWFLKPKNRGQTVLPDTFWWSSYAICHT